MSGECDKCGEHCMDCQCMTTHSDKADDLVERLLGYSSMNDHLSWRSKCEREAAAYIKELKAEVESFRGCLATTCGKLMVAEARAAKAEEALRVIATNKTRLGITWAQEYAREDPGEGKA